MLENALVLLDHDHLHILMTVLLLLEVVNKLLLVLVSLLELSIVLEMVHTKARLEVSGLSLYDIHAGIDLELRLLL